jgi:hypothetical protein
MTDRVSDLVNQPLPDGVEATVYLCIPEADLPTLNAAKKLDDGPMKIKIVFDPPGATAVKAWNQAYAAAADDGADWLVLGADDAVWHPGWLEASLQTAKETGAAVVGLNDGHKDLARQASYFLMTAEFAEVVLGGVFIPPHYGSWSFDREICERAIEAGAYAPCHEAMIEHTHPEWGTAAMDDTYRKGYAHHIRDRQIYETRKAAGWPMDYEPVVKPKSKPAVLKQPAAQSKPAPAKAEESATEEPAPKPKAAPRKRKSKGESK